MRIALFGFGRIGKVISTYLKKLETGMPVHITGFDREKPDNLYGLDKFVEYDCSYDLSLTKYDAVISALPYFLNFDLAKNAIEEETPYFDLGGRVDVSQQIQDYAAHRGATVFTDLGLAPGWVNVIAEELYDAFDEVPEEIKMRCGGIPEFERKDDLFNYTLSWSPEGLYNEYKDESVMLIDGEVKMVPSLAFKETVKIPHISMYHDFEAFTTSGGAGKSIERMRDRGVKFCSYKTMRYHGHMEMVDYLINALELDADQLAGHFIKRPARDMVILDVEVSGTSKGIVKTLRKSLVIKHDGVATAMQRATAAGLVAAVFASVGTGVLDYRDISHGLFSKWIEELGVIDVKS